MTLKMRVPPSQVLYKALTNTSPKPCTLNGRQEITHYVQISLSVLHSTMCSLSLFQLSFLAIFFYKHGDRAV